MRPLVIANTHALHGAKFVVALLYGEDGYYRDTLIVREDTPDTAVEVVCRLMGKYGVLDAELWTSTTALYVRCLQEVGIAAEIKHASDTAATERFMRDNADNLTEFYELIPPPAPPPPKPPLPRWRMRMAKVLRSILKIIEGDEKYDIT